MLKTYDWPLHIGGADVETGQWTYPVHADLAISDHRAARQAALDAHDGTLGEGVVARVALAGPQHLAEASAAAAAAFPTWRRVPLAERLAIGADIHRRLVAQQDELAAMMTADGYPARVAQWSIAGMTHILSPAYLSRNATDLHREERFGERRVITRRLPDGVVAFHPPRNAAATLSCLAIPMMLAGNTLIMRAPSAVPAGLMYLFREIVLPALEAAGAPAGVCNLVCSGAQETIEAWLEDPLINDIAFVGASDLGIHIGNECHKRGKKALLELAGNDGIVIWHDADLDRAAQAAAESFLASTQICMVPKYAIVHPDVADAFLQRLTTLADKLRPSLPSQPGAVLAPVAKANEFVEAVASLKAVGATILTGGDLVGLDNTPSPRGPFARPTVARVDGLAHAARLDAVTEETFFPLLPVVVPDVASDDGALLTEVAAFLNRNAYGLRNSLWTASETTIDRFLAEVTNGGLIKVNDSHAGTAPFATTHGGTGLSGGPHGQAYFPLLHATHLQSVSIGHKIDVHAALTDTHQHPPLGAAMEA
ncbi:aldehyde dehydrogenase family protein [Streptomyces sp. NPDC051546]|uniref:aldehyde dehydrogenase family protein n=1 Tax=Streptomyces sp. NPDC051546 TaxID=3365655 RepID=UPI0037B6946D